VGLQEVSFISLFLLVGKFGYWATNPKDIVHWVGGNWSPLLGYAPVISFLVKGVYCFTFHFEEYAIRT